MKTSQDKNEFDITYHQLPILLNKTADDLLQLTDIISIFQYQDIEPLNQLQNDLKNKILDSNWRFYYLDYDKLFKSYQSLHDPFFMSNQQHVQQDHFYQLFQQELIKVKEFYIVKSGEIERRLNYLFATATATTDDVEIVTQDIIDENTLDIQSLWHFIKINYKLFLIFIYQLDLYYKNEKHKKEESTVNNLFIQKLYLLITSHPIVQLNSFLNWISILSQLHQKYKITLSPACSLPSSSSTSIHTIHHNEEEEEKENHPSFIHPIPVPSTRTNHSSNYFNSVAESFYTTMNTFHPSSFNNSMNNMNEDDNDDKYMTSTAYHSLENDHHLNDFFLHYQQNEPHPSSNTQLKYWIHSDTILDLVFYLSKHMNMESENLHDTTSLPISEFEIDDESWHHQQPSFIKKNHLQSIQTIYLDTTDFNNYHTLMNTSSSTKSHLSLLRLRNYNYKENSKKEEKDTVTLDDSIFALENKIYTCHPQPLSTTSSSSSILSQENNHPSHLENLMNNQSASSIKTLMTDTTTINDNDSNDNKIRLDSYSSLHPTIADKWHQKIDLSSSSSSFIKNRVWIKWNEFQSWIHHQWTLSHLLMKTYNLDYYKVNQEPLSKLSSSSNTINKDTIDQQMMEIESLLHSTNQIPVMTSHSNRIVFKKEENDYKIIIQIDTDITMRPYEEEENKKNKNGRISRFPFGVLKINIYHHDDHLMNNNIDVLSLIQTSLPWLYDFLNCPLMENVNDFSIYLHGVSTLFTHKVQAFPSWVIETLYKHT
ncbi:unnamed protein product [Cunninghamella blakesleeana]